MTFRSPPREYSPPAHSPPTTTHPPLNSVLPFTYRVSFHSNDTTKRVVWTVKSIYATMPYGSYETCSDANEHRCPACPEPACAACLPKQGRRSRGERVPRVEEPLPPASPFTSMLPSNPFRSNTYRIAWKCSFQKTYRNSKSFRSNTYKKPGGGVPGPNPSFSLLPRGHSTRGHSSLACPERSRGATLLRCRSPWQREGTRVTHCLAPARIHA
jgi:hypothetical protein